MGKNNVKLSVRLEAVYCYYCERDFNGILRTVDHILPLSKGGTNAKRNLVAACSTCNGIKGNYDLYEFRYVLSQRINNTNLSEDCRTYYETVYGNVVRLIEYIPTLPVQTQTTTPSEHKKGVPGEITIVPELVVKMPLDSISKRMYNERIAAQAAKNNINYRQRLAAINKTERPGRNARADARKGYIYDETCRHKNFHTT